MAWVNAKFNHKDLDVVLCERYINIESDPGYITIMPRLKEDAHAWAMMLRKAARRLEEIGKEIE